MKRMNCWRTTWAATLDNVGSLLVGLIIGDATGFPVIHFSNHDVAQAVLMVGAVCKVVGKQLHGMASADQQEVKTQLGLDQKGFPVLLPEQKQNTNTENKTQNE